MAKATSTPVYNRLHARGLTMAQQSAVDLLAGGKNDTEAAELLGLHRTTLSKWRAYDPVFQAALNRRRAEVWAVGLDKLRALVPKALDVLAATLDDPGRPDRWKAALEVLKLAREVPPAGPTDPKQVVEALAQDRRKTEASPLTKQLEEMQGLRPIEECVAEVWQELDAMAEVNGEAGA